MKSLTANEFLINEYGSFKKENELLHEFQGFW